MDAHSRDMKTALGASMLQATCFLVNLTIIKGF